MSKIKVIKAAMKVVEDICHQDGYVRMKNMGAEPEVFYFLRTEDSYICTFRTSFSGRRIYSPFSNIKIIYKGLSNIMLQLMKGTEYETYYNISEPINCHHGIGIDSIVGRRIKNNHTLYIASVDEAADFAKMFYAQIKEQEQNFILPAVNVESTIAGFMKKLYYFWPGDLKCFIEHLVAYGMLTSDANMIDYAFKKSEEILPKLVERATPMDLMTIDFVKTVKNRIKQA